ncbi:hypothetical protein TWF281_005622 [Arthrobotrys megalospora]
MCWYDLQLYTTCGHKFFASLPSSRCRAAKKRSIDPEAEMPCIGLKKQTRTRIEQIAAKCSNCENKLDWGLVTSTSPAVIPHRPDASPSTGKSDVPGQQKDSKGKKRKAVTKKENVRPSEAGGTETKRRKTKHREVMSDVPDDFEGGHELVISVEASPKNHEEATLSDFDSQPALAGGEEKEDIQEPT